MDRSQSRSEAAARQPAVTREWQIEAKQGWLLITSGPDASAVLASAVEHFGTYDGGFHVTMGNGPPVQFQCEADHALQCWHRLTELMGQP